MAAGDATGSPAADAVLARLAPAAGVYEVELMIAVTGPEGGALTNLRLSQRIGVGILHVFTDLPTVAGHVIHLRFPRVEVSTGEGAFGLTVLEDAPANSVYITHLAMTPVG